MVENTKHLNKGNKEGTEDDSHTYSSDMEFTHTGSSKAIVSSDQSPPHSHPDDANCEDNAMARNSQQSTKPSNIGPGAFIPHLLEVPSSVIEIVKGVAGGVDRVVSGESTGSSSSGGSTAISSQPTPATTYSEVFDGPDNKIQFDDTTRSRPFSPPSSASSSFSGDLEIEVQPGPSFLGAPFNGLEEIEEIPEPCEDTLRGLQQCTQSINSTSTSINGCDNPLRRSSVASGSVTSDCSEIVQGSGSTLEHCDQEPFVTFKLKVIQLCHDIGLGEPLKVERMTGGGYNRVIHLTLPSKDNQDYVLRIPRYPDITESTKDQAAVLHYLAPMMPVPTVMAFDSTSDNALGNPYILQTKIMGRTASELYYNLPLNEKIELMKLVAGLITDVNALTADHPGQFIAGPSFPSLSHGPLTIPADVEITGYRFDRGGASCLPPLEKETLTSHLISAFKAREQRDIDRNSLAKAEMWDPLKKIAKEMKSAGLILNTDTDCVTWHWDLAFRNILVEKQTTGEWAITGVLDWDGLLAVPAVITRAPPTWLWINDDDRSTKYELGGCDDDIQPSRELTMDELILKGSFEQIMQRSDPNYMADTYGRGVWIRKLAQFAVHGFCTNQHYDRYEALLEEWEEHYKSLEFNPDMEESSDEEGSDVDEADESDTVSSSVASRSIASNASNASSTYEYDQEPFDTYRSKVIQLCHNIGFGEPSNVVRMAGGSYNRVIGLTFSQDSEDRHFVLRVPRSPLQEHRAYTIRDQVATLLFLGQYEFLCAPTITAIDTTTENVIKSQYVLQEKLPGKPLQDVLFSLPLAEKLELTTVVAQLLIKMENITIEEPGVLSGAQPLPWVSTSLLSSTLQPTISGFRLDNITVDLPLGKQGLASLLFNMLNSQKKNDAKCANVVLLWDKLLNILKQMEQAGFFKDSDSTNVLWHWDICARHIFVDKDESIFTTDIAELPNLDHADSNDGGTKAELADDVSGIPADQTQATSNGWKVTGIIDWDDAMSVPRVIARVPKTWLWYDENERTSDWDGNRDSPPERALTQEELAIKSHFDQIMQQADPNYLSDTYFRGVWIRRLFRCTQTGFVDGSDFERCDKLVEDWEAYFNGHILMTQ